VKSIDNKLTLMNILCSHCEAIDETLLDLDSELLPVEEAARINLDNCKSDIFTLRKNVMMIDEEIRILSSETFDVNDKFIEVITPFRDEAFIEIGKLDHEYNSLRSRFTQLVKSFGELDTIGAEEFFGLLRDFLIGFRKANRDNEKRKIVTEKAELKKVLCIYMFCCILWYLLC
jgi:hypothetical protein